MVSRAQAFEEAKILRVSTAMIRGTCRITKAFDRSDQRFYHVPCPQCGTFAPLTWENFRRSIEPERLHAAHFTCEACGGVITHADKESMVRQGRWVAANPKGDHPGFHLWGAYAPQRDWASIAVSYAQVMGWSTLSLTGETEDELKRQVEAETEQVFWNDVLGLPYEQASKGPDWEKLRDRAEKAPEEETLPRGILPATGFIFGAGADCQADLEIQRQIAAARAQNALTQTSRSIVDLFGVPDDADLERVKQRIAELKEAIANAAADPDQIYKFDFGTAQRELAALESRTVNSFSAITDAIGQSLEGNEAQVMAVVAALRQVEQANGVAAQAEAMANLRTALIEAADGGRTLNEEAMLLLDSLTDAELAALGLAQVDIASGIAAGADEADRLARNLARAQAAQSMLDQMAIEFSPGGQAMIKYGGRTPGGTDAQNALADRNKPKEIRGGGGGRGGGGADPDIARAKALTEGVRTETEKYAAALEEVNRLKQKGLITDETYNRQLDKLKEKLGETGDLGKKAASAIRSAFDGLFDDPQQALKDLAKQLAMMALYQGLAKGFPTIFGAGGFLPLVPGFAAGGRHRGGLRIVGENGPELEATGPSTIYPNDLLQSLGRGRSAPVIVNVTNQSGAAVETTSERGGPNGERIIDMRITESLTSGRQDKALRRFGSKPQRVLR